MPLPLLPIAAVALKALGSLKAGAAAKKAAYAEAAGLEQQAVQTSAAGAMKETEFRRAFRRQQGDAIALLGGTGLDMASGSPLDVLADSATEAEYDALKIRYQATLDRNSLMDQASARRRAGRSAQTASYFNAAGDVLGGIADYRQTQAIRKGTA